ncbi:MAG: 3-hydroxybutyryl-CoA dehydratase [Solirubrobacteraceae bacterium]|nr:3-hydroxybutyryl-CoA dehydratase [Solirubrobacteraceae bacterium]
MNWSDPFEALEPGATFTTGERTITDVDVMAFAGLTDDHHPQHVDADWSAASTFGERVAHGMLVVSCAVGLVPFDPDRVIALRGLDDVVFKRPVRLGDTIRVKGAVIALRSIGEEAGLVQWRWSVVNQRDQLVARALVEVLWRGTPSR